MFVIVENAILKAQVDLPDKDLANIVHGEYTLIEAVNVAEKLYKGYHGKALHIQEVSKGVTAKSTKKYKVVYMMINNYQSIPVYLLEEEREGERERDIEDKGNKVEIKGDHVAFYNSGEMVAELKGDRPVNIKETPQEVEAVDEEEKVDSEVEEEDEYLAKIGQLVLVGEGEQWERVIGVKHPWYGILYKLSGRQDWVPEDWIVDVKDNK